MTFLQLLNFTDSIETGCVEVHENTGGIDGDVACQAAEDNFCPDLSTVADTLDVKNKSSISAATFTASILI